MRYVNRELSLSLWYFHFQSEWTENENGFISTTCNKHKQEFKWLNGKRTQTRRRPFYTPKPDADLGMRVDLPLDKKTMEMGNQDSGPPGRRAVAGHRPLGRRGPWAVGRGPVGLRADGPVFSKTPSQPRVTSQPRVNHESSQFFLILSRKIYLNTKRTYSWI